MHDLKYTPNWKYNSYLKNSFSMMNTEQNTLQNAL
jgi:hypothetical protein